MLIRLLILPLLVCVSCKKQVPGPEGDPGTPGLPGDLRQSHTTPAWLAADAWTLVDGEWQAMLYISQITRNVTEKGEVRAYLQQEGSSWSALPYASGFVFTQYTIEPGILRLKQRHIHGSVPERPAGRYYRLVVLSPPD